VRLLVIDPSEKIILAAVGFVHQHIKMAGSSDAVLSEGATVYNTILSAVLVLKGVDSYQMAKNNI
jgi:hypothetical protein